MTTKSIIESNGSLVSTKHVHDLVSTYKLERWKPNSQKLDKPDSLSTWFGMEQLEHFISLIKQHGADGVKMFFGVYPADYPLSELAGRQTIVMVATRKSENHPGARNKALFINKNGKKELLAFNKGENCPPYCGGMPPDFDIDLSMELDPIGFTMTDENGGIEII
ncbi:hypothetical protein [Sediminibacterium goheungense]|uniref:Uncharacterized protein n=1 Tax=Sediminibacterium goheungense TaxID=1086393 RepID=A0A4R6J326_9BACT|nr:hypothetical protein [Sediminibacterium goheungense]TDO28565.1 hypothetical protein BC659_0640 [Sediminibacterium goheungense]